MQLPKQEKLPLGQQLSLPQLSLQSQRHHKRRHRRKNLHRTDRRNIQAAIQPAHALTPEQKIRKQHRTVETHLDPKGQQHRIHDQLVNSHHRSRIQQQDKAMQSLLSRKILHNQSR